MKLTELQEKYNLELGKIVSEINKEKAKKVLIQLPDGLKPNATAIVDYLKDKTNAELVIWSGSCFGACDVPQVNGDEFDLIVQFGHSVWKY